MWHERCGRLSAPKSIGRSLPPEARMNRAGAMLLRHLALRSTPSPLGAPLGRRAPSLPQIVYFCSFARCNLFNTGPTSSAVLCGHTEEIALRSLSPRQ
uniref:Uncharacterized protein n=1 Tax=Plectus sambesii TaxID=2011161 RepID=A0A914UXX7_9BILA